MAPRPPLLPAAFTSYAKLSRQFRVWALGSAEPKGEALRCRLAASVSRDRPGKRRHWDREDSATFRVRKTSPYKLFSGSGAFSSPSVIKTAIARAGCFLLMMLFTFLPIPEVTV